MTGAGTRCRDGAAVQLHQLTDERETDPETGLFADRRARALIEHLEQSVLVLERNTDPVVLHAQEYVGTARLRGESDVPAARGELRGVVQEVREHLGQAHVVAEDLDGLVR